MSKGHPDQDQIEREAVTWIRKLISADMTPGDIAALTPLRGRAVPDMKPRSRRPGAFGIKLAPQGAPCSRRGQTFAAFASIR